jgi:putative dehydrogenase
LKPGSVVISSATVAPDLSLSTLGQRLAEKNLLLLDAPVSGGAAKRRMRAR